MVLPGFRDGDPPTAAFAGTLEAPLSQVLVIGFGTLWCDAYEYIDRVTFGTDPPGFRGLITGSGIVSPFQSLCCTNELALRLQLRSGCRSSARTMQKDPLDDILVYNVRINLRCGMMMCTGARNGGGVTEGYSGCGASSRSFFR